MTLAKKVCLLCEKELGLMSGKVQIADGFLCMKCYIELGGENTIAALTEARNNSLAYYKSIYEKKKADLSIAETFQPTFSVGKIALFNDDTKYMLLAKQNQLKFNNSHYTVFDYSQIVNFELLEDGNSIVSGGLGRAIVGGVAFGGVGAIVGGVTGKKKVKDTCTSLQIKLTVKDYYSPTFYITLISSELKKSNLLYKQNEKLAQDIISKLQIITSDSTENSENTASSNDVTEQIRKFKSLLDDGLISQEEYDLKKKELLGL